MNIRYIFLSIILTGSIFTVHGEDDVKSITDEWRETLKYGIDSEVIEVIDKIQAEKRKGFNDLLVDILEGTINREIIEKIFAFFEKNEFMDGIDKAYKIVESYREWDDPLVTASLSYISAVTRETDSEYLDNLLKLAEDANDRLASRAVMSLGTTSVSEERKEEIINFLIDLFNQTETPGLVKEQILLSLGKMEAVSAADMLVQIIQDEYEDLVFRQYAVHSLGTLGDKKYLPVIKEALADDQALLRAYAASALANIEGEDVTDLLMEALRDSFWRTRKSALETLGKRKAEKAVPIIIYKARKDPEKVIRTEALRSLGKIGGEEATAFLKEYFLNERISIDLRIEAFKQLTHNGLNNLIDELRQVIAEEWEKDKSVLLNRIGGIISTHETDKAGNELLSIYTHFLTHPNIVIQIYGIRGIMINNFTEAADSIEKLTEEGIHSAVRKQALSALEELKKE